MKPALLVLVLLVPLAGCGGAEPEPSAGVGTGQACRQAEQVTDAYQDALGDAASAEDAKTIIDGAIGGLRDIDTAPPVGDRIDELAAALAELRAGVEAGTPPAELRPKAAAIGTSTQALARACGREGQ